MHRAGMDARVSFGVCMLHTVVSLEEPEEDGEEGGPARCETFSPHTVAGAKPPLHAYLNDSRSHPDERNRLKGFITQG